MEGGRYGRAVIRTIPEAVWGAPACGGQGGGWIAPARPPGRFAVLVVARRRMACAQQLNDFAATGFLRMLQRGVSPGAGRLQGCAQPQELRHRRRVAAPGRGDQGGFTVEFGVVEV